MGAYSKQQKLCIISSFKIFFEKITLFITATIKAFFLEVHTVIRGVGAKGLNRKLMVITFMDYQKGSFLTYLLNDIDWKPL